MSNIADSRRKMNVHLQNQKWSAIFNHRACCMLDLRAAVTCILVNKPIRTSNGCQGTKIKDGGRTRVILQHRSGIRYFLGGFSTENHTKDDFYRKTEVCLFRKLQFGESHIRFQGRKSVFVFPNKHDVQ